MSMALFNGLPEECNALISVLDAIHEDEKTLKFDFTKSCILQEEQRIKTGAKAAQEKSETADLLTACPSNSRRFGEYWRRQSYCNYCIRSVHIESKCWSEFPHLNPNRINRSGSKPPFIANQSDEDPIGCLIANYENTGERKDTNKWFVDSGSSKHMTFNRSIFSSYRTAYTSSVELGNSNTLTIEIPIMVNGNRVGCMLKNV